MNPLSIHHALIMAAGRGNRMRPLTDILPKPMIGFNGDTLIGNSLKMLAHIIPHIHVTVGYKKAMLSEYLMTRGGVATIINTEGHGNAWWIQHTLMKYIDEPILVLTTDNITELDLKFLEEEYERLAEPVCMLVPVTPIQGIEGDFIQQEEGVVNSISREKPESMYCSGIQVIHPVKLNRSLAMDVDDFKDVWNMLIDQNLLKVSTIYPKIWYSVDTLEQIVRESNVNRATVQST